MGEDYSQSKVITAAKWSLLAEIASKLVVPVTSIILARILAPEVFGIVATITMVVSFAEMLADAGFNKYLIQHNFTDDNEKLQYVNVAFWSNFILSAFLWSTIFYFNEQIASFVGNPGYGNVLSIASLQLMLASFSSIQTALFRRDFDFRTLFVVRIFLILIPIFVTIPLAWIGFSYWSIIIGNLATQLSNAVILTIKSSWKPQISYNFSIFKRMFSFSFWSLIESISIWLTTWIDTFIIGRLMSQHHLGLLKTSTTMVNSLLSLITSSTVPVLFSTLSRLQNDTKKFVEVYFSFQRLVSLVVFPIGVVVFLYSELITLLLLGDHWVEASDIIGNWALTSAIMIVLGNFSSEVYRAKGKPKLSFVAQVLHLIVLVPTILISARYGFMTMVYARSWIRMEFVLVHLIIMNRVIGISIVRTIRNVFPSLVSSMAMFLLGIVLKNFSAGLIWNVFSISACITLYILILTLFPIIRRDINQLVKKVLRY